VVAVVGHFNSGCSIPASQVYARSHLAMISPAASNPKLTLQQLDPSWHYPKTIFRVNTTDDIQGSYAGEFAIKTLKLRRACIIHDKTAYGQGVAEEFRKRFEALGGSTLVFRWDQRRGQRFQRPADPAARPEAAVDLLGWRTMRAAA